MTEVTDPAAIGIWRIQREEWMHLLEAAESRIKHCVRQLSDAQLWWRPFPDGNSIANQLLHVCGNLRQWCVDGIRATPGTRDRAHEFSVNEGFNGSQLLHQVTDVIDEVRSVLDAMTPLTIIESRIIQGFNVTVAGALSHSIPHLVGHTHQIMLLTRMQLRENYRFHWSPSDERGAVPL